MSHFVASPQPIIEIEPLSQEARERVQKFFQHFSSRRVEHGVVVAPGYHIDRISYLETGRIRMYSILADSGKLFTLHVFHAGAFFPIVLSLAKAANPYFFEVLEPCTLRDAPADEVIAFLRSDAVVSFDLSKRLADGLQWMTHRVELVATRSVYERTISHLLYLARHYGAPTTGDLVAVPAVTQQQIAEFIGVSREAANRSLRRLEKNGWVQYSADRQQCLIDLAALKTVLSLSI